MKLYYGNGNVRLEGDNCGAVEILYRGSIAYNDLTPDGFAISHNKNKIIVFPLTSKKNLTDLFSYEGNLRILKAQCATWDSKLIKASIIEEGFYYTEKLGESETLTLKSEDMDATHQHGRKFRKTHAIKKIIPNLNTSKHKTPLYLKDGSQYSGDYHIHIKNRLFMTGAHHNKNSKVLFSKNPRTGKISLPIKKRK